VRQQSRRSRLHHGRATSVTFSSNQLTLLVLLDDVFIMLLSVSVLDLSFSGNVKLVVGSSRRRRCRRGRTFFDPSVSYPYSLQAPR
jgi:hypothetical protein